MTAPSKVARSRFTTAETALVRRLPTPVAVQRHLEQMPYNFELSGETLRSFRRVARDRTAHCLEAALFAATVLEQHGYPPLLLDLRSKDNLDHVLFLYQHGEKFGTVARSRDPGLHGRKPVFSSLTELVRSYVLPFIDKTGRLVGYNTYDLRNLRGCNWRFSERNVWAVQNVLIAARGHRYATSTPEYRIWHARYLNFKEKHPNARPDYFPGRNTWL